MSLLDGGKEEILVFVEIDGLDDLGNKIRVVDEANPIPLNVNMQPVSSLEPTDQTEITLYTFRHRSFPGGAVSRIDWDGRQWDVVGDPKRRRRSAATRHDTIMIRARGKKAL